MKDQNESTESVTPVASDAVLDPKVQECLDRVKVMNRAHADKGTLLLTVKLSSEEEAEELYDWLYGEEKPMKSLLCSIAWDQVPVPKKVAEAIETLKESLV